MRSSFRPQKKSSESCLSLLSGLYPPPGTSPTQIVKRSRTTPLAKARTVPRTRGPLTPCPFSAFLQGNHELRLGALGKGARPGRSAMRRNGGTDNFWQPICVGNQVSGTPQPIARQTIRGDSSKTQARSSSNRRSDITNFRSSAQGASHNPRACVEQDPRRRENHVSALDRALGRLPESVTQVSDRHHIVAATAGL
jgi:hypothetical protein